MISRKLHLSILMADSAWIVSAVLIIGHFWPASGLSPHLGMNPNVAVVYMLVASLVAWSILYSWFKLDGFQRGWSWASMTSWLLIGVLLLAMVLNGAISPMHRGVAFAAIVSVVMLLYAGFVFIRMLARGMLRGFGGGGHTRRMIILGDGRIARELAAKIDEHPEMRTRVVGFLSTSDRTSPRRDGDHPRNLSTLQIIDLLREKSVTDLVVVLAQSLREVDRLVSLCRNAGITVSVVPEFYGLYGSLPKFFDVGGVPLLRVEQLTDHEQCSPWKPLIDFPLVLVFGLIALPMLAVTGLYLHFRQGRVLETETRCGRHGRPFSLYRLAITPGDPSNSWFMKLLEHTSLTELPQFWNVLSGDMSLVGPRPETPERILHYSDWHRRRLAVKPGITGWAQVHGLRNQDSSDEKTRFDLYYILNWSLLLDCAILLQTGWTLLSRSKVSLAKCHRGSRGLAKGWAKSCSLPRPHADSAQSSSN